MGKGSKKQRLDKSKDETNLLDESENSDIISEADDDLELSDKSHSDESESLEKSSESSFSDESDEEPVKDDSESEFSDKSENADGSELSDESENVEDLNDPDAKEPYRWVDISRSETEQIYINQDYEGIPAKLKGLDGILLTGHQRRNIKAMMDLENTRKIIVKTDPTLQRHIKTCAGRLSEKLGSGKTFIMLGLILANPCPAIHPELIRPFMYGQYNTNKKNKYVKEQSCKFEGFGYHFERSYKKYLNTNIIFVSGGVLVQWEKAIKKHMPDVKYMIIDNVMRLRRFESEVRSGKYDKEITVVKNGISAITGIKCLGTDEEKKDFLIPEDGVTPTATKGVKLKPARRTAKAIANGTAGGVPKTLPIITSVTHILDSMQLPCKRLFIDDFDSINIPRSALLPTSLFYWVVSSTNRQPKYDSVSIDKNDIKEALIKFHPLLSGITENYILHKALNVACVPAYTDHCVSLGKPIFKIYEYTNPNDNIANVLGAYNLGNAQQVREAINADSPKDAAKLANIESTNPLDMLERLLGEGKKNYVDSCKILKYIKGVRKELPELPNAKGDKYPEDDIAKLRKYIKAVPIRYRSQPIRDVLDDAEGRAIEVKNKNGMALDRARESLSAENCTVCYEEMDKTDIIMTKCCNNALCATCGFHATGIPNSSSLTGSCSKCRAKIGINHLIFISKDFDINSFVKKDSELEMVELEEPKKVEPEESPQLGYEKPTTKRACIVQLVKGRKVEGRVVDVHIDKLLVGKDHLPEAADKNKRFIILSNYMEILHNLLADFDKEKISALQLQGNAKQKDAIITEFKNHGKVLLINSERDCAGLNLQFATDLVFCHKIFDHNVESQVAGRIQRMGCRHQIYIHYVMYNNEVSCVNVIRPGQARPDGMQAAPVPAEPVRPNRAQFDPPLPEYLNGGEDDSYGDE